MTMKIGRMSANSVIATPSSRLNFSRLTANPLLEVRHMMPHGSDLGTRVSSSADPRLCSRPCLDPQ